jgi:hypothetical protein
MGGHGLAPWAFLEPVIVPAKQALIGAAAHAPAIHVRIETMDGPRMCACVRTRRMRFAKSILRTATVHPVCALILARESTPGFNDGLGKQRT